MKLTLSRTTVELQKIKKEGPKDEEGEPVYEPEYETIYLKKFEVQGCRGKIHISDEEQEYLFNAVTFTSYGFLEIITPDGVPHYYAVGDEIEAIEHVMTCVGKLS